MCVVTYAYMMCECNTQIDLICVTHNSLCFFKRNK